MKQIIIVAPEQYQDLARKITHEISKQPGFNGAYWTIKHYADNEFITGGKSYVVLMGNSDENRFTKTYLGEIKNLNNHSGACYGYDGSKAVIFGEGKLEYEVDFQKFIKKWTSIKDNPSKGTVGQTLGFVGAALVSSLLPTLPEFLIAPSVIYYFVRSAKVKKLKSAQAMIALTLFLDECFDEWVGIKKAEQGA
jgi:hypothetical protein